MEMQNKRIVFYIRYNKTLTFKDQLKKIAHFNKATGLTKYRIIGEKIEDDKQPRYELANLLKSAREGEIDAIIVYNHLAVDPHYIVFQNLQKEMKHQGVDLINLEEVGLNVDA